MDTVQFVHRMIKFTHWLIIKILKLVDLEIKSNSSSFKSHSLSRHSTPQLICPQMH